MTQLNERHTTTYDCVGVGRKTQSIATALWFNQTKEKDFQGNNLETIEVDNNSEDLRTANLILEMY